MNRISNALICLGLTFGLGACKSPYMLAGASRGEYRIDSTVATDSSIIKTYLPYKQRMDKEMGKVVGLTDSELTKVTGTPAETALGNFFADAVFNEARKIDPAIDFGMPTTRGGLRNTLPKGNITLSNLFELMPFDNQLLVFKMKGDRVIALFNYIAATGGQPVANLRLTIGSKQYTEAIIDGKPFDPDRTYNVITSDYIASGGDYCNVFKGLEGKSLGLLIRNALINYVTAQTAAGKTIHAQIDGRIDKN